MEKTDLVAFFKQFVPSAPASDAVVNKFVGTSAVGQGIEAQLDIQYVHACVDVGVRVGLCACVRVCVIVGLDGFRVWVWV